MILVIGFHKNLYAPSDYKDENHFVNIDVNSKNKITEKEVEKLLKEDKIDAMPESITSYKSQIEHSEIIGLELASKDCQVRLHKDVILSNRRARRIEFDGTAFQGSTLYAAEVKLLSVEIWKELLERTLNLMQNNV